MTGWNTANGTDTCGNASRDGESAHDASAHGRPFLDDQVGRGEGIASWSG